jgi:two-component system copper resistance phosphate regulon response regulator CusR
MKILLIEDERPLALAVTRILRQAGWEAEWAADGEAGYEMGLTRQHDAIVLDVLLPRRNGWSVLEGLRTAKVNTPILMLTAMDEVGDRVKGLNMGADDYLPKPFEAPELVARVNALLRRDKAHKGHLIRIADMMIDREARQVTRNGVPVPLTRREYDLLEALALNEGRILSRETIQERVWGADEAYSNTVDVFIGTLRKKLDAPFERRLIHTVVGFGYVLKNSE